MVVWWVGLARVPRHPPICGVGNEAILISIVEIGIILRQSVTGVIANICFTIPLWYQFYKIFDSNKVNLISCYYIDGLVQERHNSSVLAMELYLPCINPLIFATCENWLSLLNSCIYYAHQTHEIYQVLPYFMDFKAPWELWNPLSKTVLS